MKFPRDFTLETKRCVLRFPSLADIPYIFSAAQAPGFTDGMMWDPPLTEAELIPNFDNTCQAWDNDQAYCFTIISKTSNDFLGRIVIRQQEQDQAHTWDLGFYTHPDHYGNGYMTESVREIIRFGFEQLAAQQVNAEYALWNKASEAVLKKNQLKFLKHIPQGFLKHGIWVEENRLGITRTEWSTIVHSTKNE